MRSCASVASTRARTALRSGRAKWVSMVFPLQRTLLFFSRLPLTHVRVHACLRSCGTCADESTAPAPIAPVERLPSQQVSQIVRATGNFAVFQVTFPSSSSSSLFLPLLFCADVDF